MEQKKLKLIWPRLEVSLISLIGIFVSIILIICTTIYRSYLQKQNLLYPLYSFAVIILFSSITFFFNYKYKEKNIMINYLKSQREDIIYYLNFTQNQQNKVIKKIEFFKNNNGNVDINKYESLAMSFQDYVSFLYSRKAIISDLIFTLSKNRIKKYDLYDISTNSFDDLKNIMEDKKSSKREIYVSNYNLNTRNSFLRNNFYQNIIWTGCSLKYKWYYEYDNITLLFVFCKFNKSDILYSFNSNDWNIDQLLEIFYGCLFQDMAWNTKEWEYIPVDFLSSNKFKDFYLDGAKIHINEKFLFQKFVEKDEKIWKEIKDFNHLENLSILLWEKPDLLKKIDVFFN